MTDIIDNIDNIYKLFTSVVTMGLFIGFLIGILVSK